MTRKIAIVGASTEGFIQLAQLLKYRRDDGIDTFPDDEYVLIHDPNIVFDKLTTGVGQALHEVLEREIYFTKSWLQKYCDGVDNCGYKYVGWGNDTEKNFMLTGCGISFDMVKFRQMFLDDGGKIFGHGVKIIEQVIDSFEPGEDKCIINGEEYDYVIDCGERQPLKWDDDYMNPSVQFTNSYVSIEKPQKGDFSFIFEYAAKYGHVIGMPFANGQRWTYCYDNNINTEEEIREDFATIFPDEDITQYESSAYSWRPRVSNYVVHPDYKRYMRNGVALIDIEPSLSRSQFAEIIGDLICPYLFEEGDRQREEKNQNLLLNYQGFVLSTLQAFMSFSYQYGSRHESEFWDRVESEAADYLDSPVFTHPTVFPGKSFRNQILNDDFREEDYRIVHHRQEGRGAFGGGLPFNWMNNSNCFYEFAIGLGAPYSNYMSTIGSVQPPEEYGTIGYDIV